MAKQQQRKIAKAGINNPFRLDIPQGRFISWLAGKVAEQLASQDLPPKEIPQVSMKAASKKLARMTSNNAGSISIE